MHELAYADCADWLGVDKDIRSPGSVHCDSRLVLRAIDIQPFNLFDIDAFGAPWEHVWIVAQRRKLKRGESIALAITSGANAACAARQPNLRAAGWSSQMQAVIGADVVVGHKWFCREDGARPVSLWRDTGLDEAGTPGSLG